MNFLYKLYTLNLIPLRIYLFFIEADFIISYKKNIEDTDTEPINDPEMEWFYKKNDLLKNRKSLPVNLKDSELTDETDKPSICSQKSVQTDTNDLKEDSNVNYKEWLPFSKFDSMQLEVAYQRMVRKRIINKTLVQVKDGLYEVDLSSKVCYAIYWKESTYTVIRYNDFFEVKASRLKNKLSKNSEYKQYSEKSYFLRKIM